MNNFEIIEAVEKIICPYFKFNIEDFYGDKGSCEYPKIEEMNTLYFKLNGKDKNLTISKNEEKKMVDKITNLNVGLVDTMSVQSFGKYIIIQPYKIKYMERNFKILEGIWDYYFSSLNIEPNDYDVYSKIIDKIRKNDLDFTEHDKHNILKLINILTFECDEYEIKILEKIQQMFECVKDKI